MAGRRRTKVCAEPDCHRPTEATRCPEHERSADRARGTPRQRGYGRAHAMRGAQVRRAIEQGALVICWRCRRPITDAAGVHIGHDDHDRSITRGPEHARCNTSAAGRARHGLDPLDPRG